MIDVQSPTVCRGQAGRQNLTGGLAEVKWGLWITDIMSHRGRTICMFASAQIFICGSDPCYSSPPWAWSVGQLFKKQEGREVKAYTQLTRRRKCRLKLGNKTAQPIFRNALAVSFFFIVKASLQSQVRKYEISRHVLKAVTHINVWLFIKKLTSQSVFQPTFNFPEAIEFNIHGPLRLHVRADLKLSTPMICNSKFLSLKSPSILQLL